MVGESAGGATAGLIERQDTALRPVSRCGLRASVLRRPSLPGLALALLAWWASLQPSLLPRPVEVQVAVSGLSIALAYGLGAGAGRVLILLAGRAGHRVTSATRRTVVRGLVVVAIVVVGGGLVVWAVEQADQRQLVGMPPMPAIAAFPLVVETVVVAALLVSAGRVVGHAVRAVDAFVLRRVHPGVWRRVSIILLVALLPVASRDLVATSVVTWADARFGQLEDAATDRAVSPPTSPWVSGSPASLVGWDTLGYEGRRVVAGVTPAADLRTTAPLGAEVHPPVRVYVGVRSARSVSTRVALALEELDRTRAWDREILAVVAATGRGGVARDALAALEHLHGGDTAIVALQYGHLPSWLSFLVDRDASAVTASALYEAVRERWEALPLERRPRLLVFGESLGSYGAESAFAGEDLDSSMAALTGGVDGVLLVGPTADNALRGQLRAAGAGTPDVRVATGLGDLGRLRADARPQVLYLEHPSDPVASWTPATAWRRPAWVDAPNGRDVPDGTSWFPVVTWLQTVGDLVTTTAVPSGHGHDYDREFLAAWELLVPPAGWTDADHARLAATLGAD